jgi:thymidylate kinase
MLVAVDGIYSAGKSTLVAALVPRLAEATGRQVVTTDWNSSDLVGAALPAWKRDGRLGPHSLLLAEALDLAHRCEAAIDAHLAAGAVVVADRWVLSGIARAVVRGVDRSLAEATFCFAPRESLTVLVECDPAETLARRKALGKDLDGYLSGRDFRRTASIEADFVEYQRMMLDLYRSLAPRRGAVCRLDPATSERSVDEVVTVLSAQLQESSGTDRGDADLNTA